MPRIPFYMVQSLFRNAPRGSHSTSLPIGRTKLIFDKGLQLTSHVQHKNFLHRGMLGNIVWLFISIRNLSGARKRKYKLKKRYILHKNSVLLYSRPNLPLQGTLKILHWKNYLLGNEYYSYSAIIFSSLTYVTVKKLNHKWLKIRNYSLAERFRGSHKLKILKFISLPLAINPAV